MQNTAKNDAYFRGIGGPSPGDPLMGKPDSNGDVKPEEILARSQILLKIKEPPPYHCDYFLQVQAMKFWETSAKGGYKYKNGMDADGQPIFQPHPQETGISSARRKVLSPCLNYAGPIAKKYNSIVFTSTIKRDHNNSRLKTWFENVDGKGTCMAEFMRKLAMKASILGKYYVQMESTRQETILSEAQEQLNGEGLYCIPIHPNLVINWVEADDRLVEVLVNYPTERCVRLYTNTTISTAWLNKEGKIRKIDVVTNPYGVLNIVKIRYDEDDNSEIDDISENQKCLFNQSSTLIEELTKQTFSSFLVGGKGASAITAVSSNRTGGQQPTWSQQDIGPRKITFVDIDGMHVERLGADPSQATSIKESMVFYIDQIYRAAGLHYIAAENTGNVESAKAIVAKKDDAATMARRMADSWEEGENALIELWSIGMGGQSYEETHYEDDFTNEDIVSELQMTLDVIGGALPGILKSKSVQHLAPKLVKLTPEEEEEVKDQAEAMYELSEEERNGLEDDEEPEDGKPKPKSPDNK
jgi:hypothetical protein